MTGSGASSHERHSGRLGIDVALAPDAGAAIELAENRVQVFARAIRAGYFFPASLREPSSERLPVNVRAGRVHAELEVSDLPLGALGVLGGMLLDARHHEVVLVEARAVLGPVEVDLLERWEQRPWPVADPPFRVVRPGDLGGNYALLVEIEFAEVVPPEAGRAMLETLRLWDALSLAFPVDAQEPVEVSGAQAMFNDPRTIHYHEWDWDNADPLAWGLLVNLCCAWHRTWPIVRVQFE